MDKIDALIKFADSYPMWARILFLAGVALSVATLFLAPRRANAGRDNANTVATADAPNPLPDESATYWLTIEGVSVFGETEMEAQVKADVNGTEFAYPSLAGAKWAQVGPSMSPQQFQLPESAGGYDLRFTAVLRRHGGEAAQFVSQETVHIASFPKRGSYNLHKIQDATRSASVSAAVHYSVAARP